MQNKKSYQLIISGRVQNVGFRHHTQDKALTLGVAGFVKNEPNGDVYVEAEGPDQPVYEFIRWCHQGPSWARVFEVKVVEQPICNYTTFEIKR